MLVKGGIRRDAVQLGRYLLNASRNEQVTVQGVDGFQSQNLMDAMRELDALSAGLRSEKSAYLFHISLNPPPEATVNDEVFADAITRIKTKLNMQDQSHAAVYHSNGGRRHLHLVINRIDAATMTLKSDSYYKNRLFEVSKELFLENSWSLPPGMIDRRDKSPTSFTFEEYQQLRRQGEDAQRLKMLAFESWSLAKDRVSFENEMTKRGLYLAKGDKRDYVALTMNGKPYSLGRLINQHAVSIRERLGESGDYRTIEDTRAHMREVVTGNLRRMLDERSAEKAQDMAALEQRRNELTVRHALEKDRLEQGMAARWNREVAERSSRLPHGIAGLWYQLTGKAKAIREQAELEALAALARDKEQRQTLIDQQLADKRRLQMDVEARKDHHQSRMLEIHHEIAGGHAPKAEPEIKRPTSEFNAAANSSRLEYLLEQERRPRPEQSAPQPEQSTEPEQPPRSRLEWLQQQEKRRPLNERGAPESDNEKDRGMEPSR